MKTIKILTCAAMVAFNFCNASVLSAVMTTPPTAYGRVGLGQDLQLAASISPTTAGRIGLGQAPRRSRANLEASRMSMYKPGSETVSKVPASSTQSSATSSTSRSSTPPKRQKAYFPEDMTPEARRRFDILSTRDPKVQEQGYVTEDDIKKHTYFPSSEDIQNATEAETWRALAYITFSFERSSQKSREIIPIITPKNRFRTTRFATSSQTSLDTASQPCAYLRKQFTDKDLILLNQIMEEQSKKSETKQ